MLQSGLRYVQFKRRSISLDRHDGPIVCVPEQAEIVPCADVFRVAREDSAIERFGLCKVTRPMLLDSDRELVACVLSRCSRRLFYRHVQSIT